MRGSLFVLGVFLMIACGGGSGGLDRRTIVDSRDTEDPRSLDPALFNLSFGDLWIYLLAPLLGGLLGGAVRVVFGPEPVHEAASIRAAGGLPQVETRESLDP